MRIYGIKPEENESADLESARYINLAIEHININSEWLSTSSKPYQAVLIHVDVLLMLSRRFPVNANLLIKKKYIESWEKTFYDWFNRCGKKIPSEYRDGIKTNADDLFSELRNYGHDLP